MKRLFVLAALLAAVMTGAIIARAGEETDPFAKLDKDIARDLASDRWSPESKAFVEAMWKDYKAAHVTNKMELKWHGIRWRPPAEAERPGNQQQKKASGKHSGDHHQSHPAAAAEHGRPAVRGHSMWITSYEEYVGNYRVGGKPIEIVQDEARRFFVKLEGHTIPGVAVNNTIVFTTGDVVEARLPSLNLKEYASLEYFMIVREDGKFYFGSPQVRVFDDMAEMTRE